MLMDHMNLISKEKENIDCIFQKNSFAPVSVLVDNPDKLIGDDDDLIVKKMRADSFNNESPISLNKQNNKNASFGGDQGASQQTRMSNFDVNNSSFANSQ